MKINPRKFLVDSVVLPAIGIGAILLLWILLCKTVSKDLPSPAKTWELSKIYLLEPLAHRGEMDQGILRLTFLSLILVAKGYAMGLLIGTPLGFLFGTSKTITKIFDPVCQIFRPVSPLAWYPLGLVLFASAGKQTSEFAALFTIAICSMWPTVVNTALGVRSVPQDYLNVARVLKLSPIQRIWKILLPAALPYMFTGYRLSLGIAWLVIVAVEMLTGRPGLGGFLYQEYISGVPEHMIFCIIAIGIVGFILDRIMNLVEKHIHAIMALPSTLRRLLTRNAVVQGGVAHGVS